ncbi:Amidinotransferase [Oopsacas minuta]|uniref:Amidinotransferase n=1 Tax=Oopsacas minuta TaxID=111878 RepID=A0AAV7K8J8_9METZ|nr:Amidinotransferase [Oopsacas minuta]
MVMRGVINTSRVYSSHIFFNHQITARYTTKKDNLYTQVTDTLLMIQPVNFHCNDMTKTDNTFQVSKNSPINPQAQALREFNTLVSLLRSHRINVYVRKDTPEPVKPDAVFPNNWVSFHPEGVVLYPMRAENRRYERRIDVLKELIGKGKKYTDFSKLEEEEMYLEGTGSLVLDRVNRKAYANISPRTHITLVKKFCTELKFEPIVFSAKYNDIPIYHTNVLMSVGAEFAIICLESISSKSERTFVLRSLEQDRKEVIEISIDQCSRMLGNCLQVRNSSNQLFIVMSEQARNALTSDMCQRLSKHGTILSSDLTTIETLGGGSARCMIAEIY